MNEDYLWDKTGQPDPEIQQLEEILGTFRYQPQPLEFPNDLKARRKRRYFPMLAIAASVLLAILAAGVWLRVRTRSETQQQQAKGVLVQPKVENKDSQVPIDQKNEPNRPEERLVINNKRRNRPSSSRLERRERDEAVAAKEQVMLALRLASEKLNLAHRKTQSTTPANQIKNQHRIG